MLIVSGGEINNGDSISEVFDTWGAGLLPNVRNGWIILYLHTGDGIPFEARYGLNFDSVTVIPEPAFSSVLAFTGPYS